MCKVSVIICCHNSSKTIARVLLALLNQTVVNNNDYEIIMIDNNCSDDTIAITWKLYEESNAKIAFIVLKEKRIGLNYARSKGILNSNGEIIVFCDDDNVLFPNYLFTVFKLFDKYPKLGCIGPGIIEAVDENMNRLSELFRSFFQDKYIDGELSLGGPDHNWKNMPAGTGMAVRRTIALQFSNKIEQGIYSNADRSGNSLTSGGDTQIVYNSLLMNYDVGLSDRLSLKHITIEKKLKTNYIKKMYFGVYSCQQAHLEAWPDHRNEFMTEPLASTIAILYSHFKKYKHNSLKLGKYKHLIAALAKRYGILQIRNQQDLFLNVIINFLKLK